jgi:hypothetical protein
MSGKRSGAADTDGSLHMLTSPVAQSHTTVTVRLASVIGIPDRAKSAKLNREPVLAAR